MNATLTETVRGGSAISQGRLQAWTVYGDTYNFEGGAWKYNGASHWLDCATCGRAPVTFEWRIQTARGLADGQVFVGLYRSKTCQTCGAEGKVVSIKLRVNRKGNPRGCSGACLNGKTSCDCKCQGLCHGAGECRCAA